MLLTVKLFIFHFRPKTVPVHSHINFKHRIICKSIKETKHFLIANPEQNQFDVKPSCCFFYQIRTSFYRNASQQRNDNNNTNTYHTNKTWWCYCLCVLVFVCAVFLSHTALPYSIQARSVYVSQLGTRLIAI